MAGKSGPLGSRPTRRGSTWLVIPGMLAAALVASVLPASAASASTPPEPHSSAAATPKPKPIKIDPLVSSGHPRKLAGPRKSAAKSNLLGAPDPSALTAREAITDLAVADREAAATLAHSSGERVRINDELTARTTTYANPDGTYTLLTHAGVVRVPSSDGWAEINTNLFPALGRVAPAVNAGRVSFSGGGTDHVLATDTPAAAGSDPLQLLWPEDLPTPVTVGSTAIYPNVQPGVDLIAQALPEGFEFSLRLRSRPQGAMSFTLPLHLPAGWTAAQDGAGVVLRNAAGNPAGTVSGTHATGSALNPTTGELGPASDTTTRLTPSGDAIVVEPDTEFLQDPATVFPVLLDPQISLGDNFDTFVDQKNPSTTYYSSYELQVGAYSSSGTWIKRSFINFDTRGIASTPSSDIVSASIGIVPEQTSSCTNFTVEVWNTNALASTATTWSNRPVMPTHYGNITLQDIGTGCSGGQVQTTADVTSLVQTWAGNGSQQNAVGLKIGNETDIAKFARFFSADYANTAQHPYIGVIYNGIPFKPVSASASVGPGTGTCTVSWVEDGNNSYPSNDFFRVDEYDNSGFVTSQYSPDGTSRSMAFTGLNPTKSYSYQVYGHNSFGYSQNAAATNSCVPNGVQPTTPQSVSASSGDQSVTATWQAPSNAGTTAAVTGYSVQLQTANNYVDGTNIGSPVTVGSGTLSYTFPGSSGATVNNGTAYQVKVTALSNDGNSLPAYSNATTPAGVPAAPTIRSVAEGDGPHPGTTDVLVRFDLGSNGGVPIDSCRADAFNSSGALVTSATVYGSDCGKAASGVVQQSQIDVSGLAYGTYYSFKVTAHNGSTSNSAGNGAGRSPYSGSLSLPTGGTGTDGTISKVLLTAPNSQGFDVGDNLTYKITVTAPGSNKLIVSSIRDLLPPGLRTGDTPAVTVTTPSISNGSCASLNLVCSQVTQVINGTLTTVTQLLGSGAGLQIPAGQSYSFTFPVTVTGDNSTVAGVQARACQTMSNTAQLLDNYHGTDPATSPTTTTPAVVSTGCNGGLGTEAWWSYVHTAVGVAADAAVNVANGNLVVTATDSTPIQGRGHLAQVLRRAYNSQDTTLETLPGSLGKGWQLNLGMTDGLADGGVTGEALRVPSVTDLISTVSSPLGVTLIDRDGTRHSFTPRLLGTALPVATAAAAPGLAAVAPQVISVPAGRTGCVDVGYDPPAGVHLALWRYLSVSSSNNSCVSSTWNTTSNPPVVLGYAAIRPDRLRTEYDATGQLLALTDPAGASLRYSWNSLHQLTSVTEAPCAAGATCRSTTFSYTASNGMAATSNSDLSALATSLGRTALLTDLASMTATDPAGRVTSYTFTTSTLGGAYPTGVRLLTAVINPDDGQGGIRDRVDYHYQADAAGTSCGGSPGQLCTVTDERNNTSTVGYDTGSNGPLLGPARVISVRDRRRDSHTSSGYPTLLSYNNRDNTKGTVTTVTWQATGNGATPANADRQAIYSGIDSTGRVGKLLEGPSGLTDSNALHATLYTWDTPSSPCGGMTKQDNDLCTLTRAGSAAPSGSDGAATADEKTSWRYDDAGMVLQTNRVLDPTFTPGGDLVTTHGYARQWAMADGTTAVDTTTESDNQYRSTATPATPALVLYTLADLTSTVSPRGNAGTPSAYRTSYTVDNLPSASPATTRTSGNCLSSGVATGNTGLVCAVTTPYAAGTATSTSSYDSSGALLTRTDPNGNTTRYGYYPDGSTDLSGTTSAGGWLKTITDATGSFVAFGYDAAGHVVRSWDRTATTDSGLSSGSYPGTLASPPATGTGPVPHTDARYGPGALTDAAAHPWRWQLASTDNLANTTSVTRDAAGNVLSSTTARGNTTVMSYDENNQLLSVLTPSNAALTPKAYQLYAYDAFGDRTVSTDPAFAQANSATPTETGRTSNVASRTYYDAVGRPSAHYTVRQTGTSLSSPAPCANTSTLGDPMLPTSALVCVTNTAYDSVDNTVWTRDAAGQATSRSYDPVHRLVRTISPAVNATGIDASADLSRPQTGYAYDRDGNTSTVCRPRQYTEYGGSCTDTATGDVTHTSYDAANRPVSQTRYRSTTASYTSTSSYDAAGNVLHVTDGNGHVTDYGYDVLNRRITTDTPRDATTKPRTAALYDPSGSVIGIIAPGTTAGALRVTGMRLDADHRTVDTVTGLQVTLPASSQAADASNRAALRAAVNGALDSATSTGTSNTRSRTVYDADGNPVARYTARAFTSTVPSVSDRSDPNLNSNAPGGFSSSYMIRTDYDLDNRPVATWTARADNTVTDPLASSLSGNEAAQCTTAGPSTAGLPRYPGGVRLCSTTSSYDPDGRVVSTVLPTATSGRSGRKTSNSYLVDGLLAATTNPAPSDTATSSPAATVTTSYGYDGAGRRTSITEPVSPGHSLTTITDYSPAGTVVTTTPPAGPSGLVHWTKYTYNIDGQLARMLSPQTRNSNLEVDSEVRSYSSDGLLSGLAQPGATTALADLRQTVYSYDNAGNTISVLSPSGFAGDTNNPNKVATALTYTFDNLLLTTTTPYDAQALQARRTTNGYDPAGRLTSVLNDRVLRATGTVVLGGTPTSKTYAPNDRLVSETGNIVGGDTRAYSYDADGNQTCAVANTTANTGSCSSPGTGATTIASTFYLDGLIRTVTETHPTAARTSSYSYDGSGQPIAWTNSTGSGPATSTVVRNDAGLPVSQLSTQLNSSTPTTWTYNDQAQPLTKHNVNGTIQNWTYNDASDDTLLSTGLASPGSGTNNLANYTFNYDEQNRILTQTHTLKRPDGSTEGPTSYSYGYDPAGRQSTFVNGNVTLVSSYDKDNNRLTYGVTGGTDLQSSTYNADDSPATFKPDNKTGTVAVPQVYDVQGNLSNDGCTSYSYTGFNQTLSLAPLNPLAPLAQCKLAKQTFSYDALGRQTQRTNTTPATATVVNPGVTRSTELYYRGLGRAVLGEASSGGSGPATLDYTLTSDGQPIADTATGSGAGTEYLTDDGTGNTTATTSAAGDATCNLHYTPSGENTDDSATASRAPTASPCSSGTSNTDKLYRSERRDDTTGNYQLGDRTYSPNRASFTSADTSARGVPFGSSTPVADPLTANTYSYVNGDPVNLFDPTGHRPACDDDGTRGGRNACKRDLAEVQAAQAHWVSTHATEITGQNRATARRIHLLRLGEMIFAAGTGNYPSTDAAREPYSLDEEGLITSSTCSTGLCPTNWNGTVNAWLVGGDYSQPDVNSTTNKLLQDGYLLLLALVSGGESLLAREAVGAFVESEAVAAEGTLSGGLRNLALSNLRESGDTVLGRWPGYIDKAQARGASYFDIGEDWGRLEAQGIHPWTLNQEFLDVISARGDRVLLSVPKTKIPETGYLRDEVNYLINRRGYKWVNQWSLRPGG